ncbi:MAG: heat-inducible transcriptional repressor HrcA [Gemmatimonadota bacterium]|nr:heat-inducible transcriptional repressor HrcA [Gemmatimonadota bacterium]MDH5759364.1 heat-inducible transcriptional repressor HrcA [Gemmatimonadota bacterium]
MAPLESRDHPAGEDLSDRERQVLEAVVRTYVDTAEPAGSRTVSRRYDLGVSAATVRNTMSDLEGKGYLFHPHTSAGRIPTDLAYRFFVDRLMEPQVLTELEQAALVRELGGASSSAVERLVRQAVRALSLISNELGVALAPSVESTVLEKLELIQVASNKVLMVATIRGGVVRTVYVDLPVEVPRDTLVTLTVIMNERLAGLSLDDIRRTLPDRLRDVAPPEEGVSELLNIFVQSGSELFNLATLEGSSLHLGNASVLAAQPEFESGERLKELIALTESTDLIADAMLKREHGGRMKITIGGEHSTLALSEFTLVTAEYRVGGLQGVIGVIGPTRMPYEKVVAIVGHTSTLVSRILES